MLASACLRQGGQTEAAAAPRDERSVEPERSSLPRIRPTFRIDVNKVDKEARRWGTGTRRYWAIAEEKTKPQSGLSDASHDEPSLPGLGPGSTANSTAH